MPTSYKDHPTLVALGKSLQTNPSLLEEGAEGKRGGLNKSLPVVQD